MSGALIRYRVMAYVTGVVLLVATVWAIVGYAFMDYLNTQPPSLYSLLWLAHGWLYMIYLVTAVDLTFRARWSLWATLGILIAGTIPCASFFAEKWVTARVQAQQDAVDLREGSPADAGNSTVDLKNASSVDSTADQNVE